MLSDTFPKSLSILPKVNLNKPVINLIYQSVEKKYHILQHSMLYYTTRQKNDYNSETNKK